MAFLQPNTVSGPTATSPSTSAFVSDPTMGPGVPCLNINTKGIASAGSPVCNLPAPETAGNFPGTPSLATVITDVFEQSLAGNCPAPGAGSSSSLSPGGVSSQLGEWQIVGGNAVWVYTATSGPGPAPAGGNTNWNEVNGQTSTQGFLSMQQSSKGVTQGTPALNAPQTFAGVLPANSVSSYRWE
jgi:hypothetical protein